MNKVKTKPATITEKEFKEIFNLSDDYKIPKTTINQYIKYIKGSYLLYKELYNIREKNFSMLFNGKRIKLRANWSGSNHKSYQEWLMALSNPKIEVSYWDKNKNDFDPFWTYTMFEKNEKHNAASLAYESFICNVLSKIRSKYQSKYQVELKFRDMSERGTDLHNPIWLNGVEFMMKLEIKAPRVYDYISTSEIKESITNAFNIWPGDYHKPVERIIKSLR